MQVSPETLELANSPIVRAIIEKFPLPAAMAINERIHTANTAYAALTGFASPEAMRGVHVASFIHEADRERFLDLNRNRHAGLTSGQVYRWKYSVRGGLRIVEGRPTIFSLGGDTILISTLTDITGSVQREQELEREKERLRQQNRRLLERISGELGIFIGASPAMKKTMDEAMRLAATDANMVILGETGSGKSLLARIIHDISARSGKPFVRVNCAAIPEQLLESEFFGHERGAFTGAVAQKAGFLAAADGGTLFLDEVGELALGMQAKLLHAVENKRFTPVGSTREVAADVRLICATNRDLLKMMREGALREDFFYRIFVGDVRVPPLRERRQDIPALVRFFFAKFGREQQEDPAFAKLVNRLLAYSWPGNVRELQNVLLRYAATGELRLFGAGRPEDAATLPQATAAPGAPRDEELNLAACLEKAERACIQRALALCHGRKDRAARLTGQSLRTFHRRCARLGL